MGEQYIDLFAAGAYALVGRIFAALAQPGLSWLFYVLAAGGTVYAIFESALDQRPDAWLRHLAAVCLASFLTLMPQAIDLSQLTYGAPGQIEQLFGTRTGAAPHLTYWIERLGATAASDLRAFTHRQAVLPVPGVAAQVDEIVSDPATINDRQVKANLQIWRRRIVPQFLRDHPDLTQKLRDAGLIEALLDPRPTSQEFVGKHAADEANAVRTALASAQVDIRALVIAQSPMVNQIAQDAGAAAWIPGAAGTDTPTQIPFTETPGSATPRATQTNGSAYLDALRRADSVASDLRRQLPQAGSPVAVSSMDQLYDLLGRSVLYSAGTSIMRDDASRAAIGSLCQRSGDTVCRGAMVPLIDASTRLHVPDADRYNTGSWTTWLQQPITTILLTITSLLLGALSTLVVSVLPFALGVAKAIAIVISTIGAWLLLWPGRGRIALSWMIGPISFVSLWSVLFNIWADIEPSLSQIASVVGGSENGSWSAGRAMSIAISLGYLGLPSLALGVIYGESGRAMYHASARLETALLMAWHTRGAILSFGRRWLVNSPLGRRWNQRAYRAVGLGTLRQSGTRRAPVSGAARAATNRGAGSGGLIAKAGTSGASASPAPSAGAMDTTARGHAAPASGKTPRPRRAAASIAGAEPSKPRRNRKSPNSESPVAPGEAPPEGSANPGGKSKDGG